MTYQPAFPGSGYDSVINLVRAKGPAIYIAQPSGLGIHFANCSSGPTARPFVLTVRDRSLMAGPLALEIFSFHRHAPARWAGLSKFLARWAVDPLLRALRRRRSTS